MSESVEQILQHGLKFHSWGQTEIASQIYTTVLTVDPRQPEANYNMGLLAISSGRTQAALAFFETALETDADTAEHWVSYIDALLEIGRTLDAQAVFNQAKNNGARGEGFDKLQHKLVEARGKSPKISRAGFDEKQKSSNILDSFNLPEAIRLANRKARAGIPEEAASIYQDILYKFPNNKRARNGIKSLAVGSAKHASKVQDPPQDQLQALIELYSQGLLQHALKQAENLIQQFSRSAILFNVQGNIFKDLKQFDLSRLAYERAIALMPDFADAYNNMGNALKEQGKLEEATEAYNKALAIEPDYANGYYNLGVVLKEQGKLEEAIETYKKALVIKPDFADAYTNMGNALKDQGKLEQAIDTFNMAIAIKPDDAEAHYNLSFALLNSGRLKQGLDESEWRWKVNSEVSGERRFLQPVWDGKVSLADKRILVWCEQGIGDIIRCSHLLPSISSQAQHCILECPEKLIPLFSNSFPNVEVRPENRRRDLKRDDFDVHLPTGSLHKLFLTEVIQNTRPSAFLVPDPIRINFWKSRLSSLGSGPYVGISWKSSLMQRERLKFYPPISDWAPLLELENITFINLQYADSKNDLIQMKNAFGVKVHNFDDLDQYNNLADVAALCAALDCVVSISNAVPTISAGVGTPTKYAVPAIYDWNNIIGHPVGPAVDIFKRNRHLPWSNVFGLIADDIAKL